MPVSFDVNNYVIVMMRVMCH